jgi:isopentenyl-diphosphate delta-isomerase type 1
LSNLSEETFVVVDEDDEIIGKASRTECHEKGLIHRSVMFFVFDEQGRILVTKRTQNKDFFPGYWSIALGGHVHSGETYEEAVVREAKEEVGLEVEPTFLTSFKKRIPEEKENVRVYSLVAKVRVKLDEGELDTGIFLGMNKLEGKIGQEEFLPETEVLLGILKNFVT